MKLLAKLHSYVTKLFCRGTAPITKEQQDELDAKEEINWQKFMDYQQSRLEKHKKTMNSGCTACRVGSLWTHDECQTLIDMVNKHFNAYNATSVLDRPIFGILYKLKDLGLVYHASRYKYFGKCVCYVNKKYDITNLLNNGFTIIPDSGKTTKYEKRFYNHYKLSSPSWWQQKINHGNKK
ncbi:hypothetical protein MM5_124 [Morganella phage vB_Mm5]